MKLVKRGHPNVDDDASEALVRQVQGQSTIKEEEQLEARLQSDRAFEAAYRRMEGSWAALDRHAETPEIMRYREEALAYVRRANARRWLDASAIAVSRPRVAAAIAGIALAIGIAWLTAPFGYGADQYRTGIGEQRIIELDDRSRLALDAATSLRVRYSRDARTVELMQGQAQFSVARDPARPFKVLAGDRVIVAVGTVFTVEFTDHTIRVAMIEGRVAVVGRTSSPGIALDPVKPGAKSTGTADAIELSAGEGLQVSQSGQTTVTAKADLEAATAWREGKLIFRGEELGEAVSRVNRYSHVQIAILDKSLAAHRISGVFEAGDSRGFVDAVRQYLPVTVDSSEADRISLRTK
jgi:transmembrane sensor